MVLNVSIETNLIASYQHEDDGTLWQDTAQTTAAGTGDPVGSWDDQTGSYDLQQGTTADKPSHTSDGIEFDGSSDILTNTALVSVLAYEFTIYIVGACTLTNDNQTIFSLGDQSEDRSILTFKEQFNKWRIQNRNLANILQETDSVASSDTDTHVFCLKFSSTGNAYTAYVDGTQVVTQSVSGVPYGWDILNIGALGRTSNTQHAAFDFLAVYAYNAVHNDTDRNTIEGDLTSAYIASNQELAPDSVTLSLALPEPTIANDSAQTLSPDAVSLSLALPEPTVSNDTAQTLTPDAITLSLSIGEPTISNVSGNTLQPDPVTLSLAIEQPTISNGTAQTLSPDGLALTLDVLNPTVSNDTAQSLSPDSVSLSLSIEQPTISNDSAQALSPNAINLTLAILSPTISLASQSLSPNPVTLSLSVLNPAISNGTAQALSPSAITLSLAILNPTISLASSYSGTLSGTIAIDNAIGGTISASNVLAGTIEVSTL